MNEDNTEALNNLISSIKEKMGESNNDLSNVLNNNSNQENSQNNTQASENSFDPQLLLKVQKIMSAMNGNNPKKNLLLSLKPFLRKTRQDKINDYITILNIISALDSFKKGSE